MASFTHLLWTWWAITILLLCDQPKMVRAVQMTLFDGNYQTGKSTQLNVTTSCLALSTDWTNRLKSVDTEGSCLYMFKGTKCGQNNLIYKARRYDQEGNVIPAKTVGSISLCTLDLARPVDLYPQKNLKGTSTRLEVPGGIGKCIEVPKANQGKIGSLNPARPRYCHIFWTGTGCTKEAVRIVKGTPEAYNVAALKLPSKLVSAQTCRAKDRDPCTGKNTDTDKGPPPTSPPTDE